jgi:hypothetical protein
MSLQTKPRKKPPVVFMIESPITKEDLSEEMTIGEHNYQAIICPPQEGDYECPQPNDMDDGVLPQ